MIAVLKIKRTPSYLTKKLTSLFFQKQSVKNLILPPLARSSAFGFYEMAKGE